jgi:GAF domain-containing protein
MTEVPSTGGAAEIATTATAAGSGPPTDPHMEAVVEGVRRWVGVPVALVSLLDADRDVFVAMSGPAGPRPASVRRQVGAGAEQLIVTDARDRPELGSGAPAAELGAVAYVQMPLTDEAGNVLGSLWAIDGEPRDWTPTELDLLRGLAEAASTELRLRRCRSGAVVERRQRDEFEQRLQGSSDRSQALLAASEAFTDTVTVEDVRQKVGELMKTELRPSYVGLALLEADGRLRRMREPAQPRGIEDTGPWLTYDVRTAIPTATAVRQRRIVAYGDRPAFDADHAGPARKLIRDLDLHAVVAVPLMHVDGPVGALALGWDAPRSLESADLLTVTTVAGYAAQALDRARRLHQRDSAAHQLQQAMLTTLPTVPGLTMSARYKPADSREDVGGDWYDAVPVPDPDRPGDRVLAVSVGDIIGHALDAATVMGQARSMLRQAAWDHPGEPPSHTLSAFELAADGIGLRAMGTALLAHLRLGTDQRWSMTWTNAGHPPPILIRPDGAAMLLDGHDILFGLANLVESPRRDHRVDLAPGSTLFLYTDGLVEHRGSDLDEGTDRLVRLLTENRHHAPPELVDLAVETLAPDSPDDVVAFAVHVPAHTSGTTPGRS